MNVIQIGTLMEQATNQPELFVWHDHGNDKQGALNESDGECCFSL